MALTWQGAVPASLPASYDKSKVEGRVRYQLRRAGGRVVWSAQVAGEPRVDAPVEAVVGGPRHGLSFLARVTQIGGAKLARATLVETRFLESAHQRELLLSPGFPAAEPESYETAIGHALSPAFETQCLNCHGRPGTGAAGESGVRCESCHGPGQAHVAAVSRGNPRSGIVSPARLSAGRQLDLCNRCHSGFNKQADPLPDELLVSSQVAALKSSECFRQSGGGLTCGACHDAHGDASGHEAAYVAACRKCHQAEGERHAAVCPVNQREGCIGCHMPRKNQGGFEMVDHWIRVHPELPAPARQSNPAFASRVAPVQAFLRLIVVTEEAKAREIRRQLVGGAAFSDLASRFSVDPSAAEGGYLGEVRLANLTPVLRSAAASLRYGEVSPVLSNSGKFLLVARMPRDFRFRAAELKREADEAMAGGDLRQAASTCREALEVYPAFLRAIFFMAVVEQQTGNLVRAAEYLETAVRMYPEDATARLNLGVIHGARGDGERAIEAYRRALSLDPDMVAAYLNLGAALFSAGRMAEAIGIFRTGLRVNPISAPLYYSLGVAEQRQGNAAGAQEALAIAAKIDPEFVRRQQGN